MPSGGERAYGCLFCITGKEEVVAERIRQACPEVKALTARLEKHRSIHGQKTKVEAIFLPSYVFFEAPIDLDPSFSFPREHLIRILTMSDGRWQLIGGDERFARWLFEYNGLLGFSKAYKEGARIRVVSGPLKDMEGRIQRIDKRGRSGQVSFEFDGRSVTVWLGFDLIDALPQL